MSLLDCYLPVFKQVLKIIGTPSQFDDYQLTRHDCIQLLDLSIKTAGELDISEKEKEAARAAVIAWLDETVLRSELIWRHHWQGELLQRKYLNITIAGEHFFTLLNQLDPLDEQARLVFLFCLQQGFQGQYSSPDEQPALREVICEQRRFCLPEEWLTWPNEALIVPKPPASMGTMTQRLRPLLTMSVSVALLYTIIYFSLYHYVF
ncbi:DotU family type IV/VI secretion system protein [Buttiauxella sp. S19-1]|uniref:DotU family type IV/VI secretion system protein n=1 Tax=Buttiauxella sp. S19-1 TaxID=941430 RepID=UPI001EDBB227|nr:DotU family type IV/VI secretion system protein [Buttiauxella sp. S19-1]